MNINSDNTLSVIALKLAYLYKHQQYKQHKSDHDRINIRPLITSATLLSYESVNTLLDSSYSQSNDSQCHNIGCDFI